MTHKAERIRHSLAFVNRRDTPEAYRSQKVPEKPNTGGFLSKIWGKKA